MKGKPKLARVFSAELEGIDARIIEVETDLHSGLHAFNIVGLGDKAVGEAKERVNSAIKNSGAKPPNKENRRITVNLAPADIKKTGSQYDLAIAIGYLLTTGQIKQFKTSDKLFVGELALDGRLRPINGTLNIAEEARRKNIRFLFLPEENTAEASAIEGLRIVGVRSLSQAMEILEGSAILPPARLSKVKSGAGNVPDISEIKGLAVAKRALTIAAAGGHNVLFVGPPGVGKSFLAKAMAGILPELAQKEAIEITKIWSAAGLSEGGLISVRPFRSPHQTASMVSIVGGGSNPKPGEISLAHRGVLFLDELPEYPRNVLEALRAPMENGEVHVSRARKTLKFPARFMLIAAMNPCPCGYSGDPEKECKCSAREVERYQRKISGPLLDRIDLQIRVPRISIEELRSKSPDGKSSHDVRESVESARNIQLSQREGNNAKLNSQISPKYIEKTVSLDKGAESFLASIDGAGLSPRSYHRLVKVARTIADLEKAEKVTDAHLAEAYGYRFSEEELRVG